MKITAAICFLVLLSPGCFADSPLSKENKPQQAAQGQPATSAHQSITEASPLFVKIEPSESLQEKAANKAASEDRDAWDRRMAMATIALAIITTLLAVFTGGLWYHTYKLAKGAEAASKAQAADMRESLRIAKESADSTKDMVARMTDTAERQLRAYVTIVDASGINDETGKFQREISELPRWYRVVIQNTGQTPARNVHVTCDWTESLGSVPQRIADEAPVAQKGLNDGEGVLGRDKKSSIYFSFVIGPRAEAFNAAYQNMREKHSILFFFGTITYDDVYGRKRRATTFCHTVRMGDSNESEHAVFPGFNEID